MNNQFMEIIKNIIIIKNKLYNNMNLKLKSILNNNDFIYCLQNHINFI